MDHETIDELRIQPLLLHLWREETGVTTVEYAILLALISLAAMFWYHALGHDVRRTVRFINRRLRRALYG